MEIISQQYKNLFGNDSKELALAVVKDLITAGLLPNFDIIRNHSTGEIRIQQSQYKQIEEAIREYRS